MSQPRCNGNASFWSCAHGFQGCCESNPCDQAVPECPCGAAPEQNTFTARPATEYTPSVPLPAVPVSNESHKQESGDNALSTSSGSTGLTTANSLARSSGAIEFPTGIAQSQDSTFTEPATATATATATVSQAGNSMEGSSTLTAAQSGAVGGALGGLAVLAVLGGLLYMILRRGWKFKIKHKSRPEDEDDLKRRMVMFTHVDTAPLVDTRYTRYTTDATSFTVPDQQYRGN